MEVKIELGQRFLYKGRSFHFVAEVIRLPAEYMVVQHISGTLAKGEISNSYMLFNSPEWTLLLGQEKPLGEEE